MGDVHRALGVLEHMYEDGLQPDAITYTSLIKTAAYAHDARMAEQVRFEQSGMYVHTHFYGTCASQL